MKEKMKLRSAAVYGKTVKEIKKNEEKTERA